MKWNELQDPCKVCRRLRCWNPKMSGDHDYACGSSLYFIKLREDCNKFDPDIEAIKARIARQFEE